jgi:hypothetical protein
MQNSMFQNFSNNQVETKTGGNFFNQAGIFQNAEVTKIEYEAATSKAGNPYEALLIGVKTEDGLEKDFRVFVPNSNSIFQNNIYVDGKIDRQETVEEATNRIVGEFNQKLFAVMVSQVPEEIVKAQTANCNSFKNLIETCSNLYSKVLSSKKQSKVNFITLFQNNNNKSTSNLVIPDMNKIAGVNVWIEKTEFNEDGTVKPSNIKVPNRILEGKDKTFSLEEKYPYVQNTDNNDTLGNSMNTSSTEDDDLPF